MLPGPPTSTLFPTRRSSDLLGVGGERLHLARLEQLLGVQVGDRQRLGALVEGFGLGEDRKSTRLNSSHPSISYAVFCLKKKRKRAAHQLRGTVVVVELLAYA